MSGTGSAGNSTLTPNCDSIRLTTIRTRTMRFPLRRFCVAIVVAVACSSSERGATGSGDVGGTLTIALPAEPGTLMPLLVQAAHEKEVVDQMFDALAEIDP